MYIVQPRGNVIDFDIFQHKRDRQPLLVDRVTFLWNWSIGGWVGVVSHCNWSCWLIRTHGTHVLALASSVSIPVLRSCDLFLRRFVDFLSDSFFPFLLSLAIMVRPALCWVIAAAGRRNGFINRSFTSTTLYSFTGGEDKGRGRRMMLLEMLVTRGTSQKSSWRTGRLLWRLWKTICEERVRLSAQYVL